MPAVVSAQAEDGQSGGDGLSGKYRGGFNNGDTETRRRRNGIEFRKSFKSI
jgi:hypothetical protein